MYSTVFVKSYHRVTIISATHSPIGSRNPLLVESCVARSSYPLRHYLSTRPLPPQTLATMPQPTADDTRPPPKPSPAYAGFFVNADKCAPAFRVNIPGKRACEPRHQRTHTEQATWQTRRRQRAYSRTPQSELFMVLLRASVLAASSPCRAVRVRRVCFRVCVGRASVCLLIYRPLVAQPSSASSGTNRPRAKWHMQ